MRRFRLRSTQRQKQDRTQSPKVYMIDLRAFAYADLSDYSAYRLIMFRMTLLAFSMLSRGMNSILPWKLWPPANILGQGSPMKEEWVLNIKKQADARNIPFFFKQWGTWSKDGKRGNKKSNGKVLQGQIVQNMPEVK